MMSQHVPQKVVICFFFIIFALSNTIRMGNGYLTSVL